MLDVVDSEQIVVAGSAFQFSNTLTIDGSAYNLTGKTVKITLRREDAPSIILDSTLEDHAVTVTTPLTGAVTATITAAESAYLSPEVYKAGRTVPYVAQYKVVEDNYFAPLLRFHVRPKLD
jgi:hypothetical protein